MLTIITALFGLALESQLPQPTMSQEVLIKRLGDDNYEIREEANSELLLGGRNSLAVLHRESSNPDPEIAIRCQRSISELLRFGDSNGNMPGIHGLLTVGKVRLPRKKYFQGSFPLAKYYWKRYGYTRDYYEEDQIELQSVTRHFATDLFYLGYTHKEITTILNKIQAQCSYTNYSKLVQN